MRILHVNKYLYRRGGAEGYLQDVAALQAAHGHDVEFFGMRHPENDPHTYAEHFAPYVELEPHPPGPRAKATAAARMLWSLPAQRGMEAVVRDFRPDVVHLHNIYHQLSPSVLRPAVAAGAGVVMTLHDYKMACPTYQFLDHGQVCEACLGGRFQHAVRRRCKDDSLAASGLAALELGLHTRLGAYDPVSVFIAPSRFAHDKMVEAGMYPDRVRWTRHFIDLDGVPAQDGPRPDGAVLYAGRLAPEKAVDTLVRAVGAAGPRVRLDVAGTGPSEEALRQLAEQVAPGRVTFLGRLGKADLHDLMRRSLALAMPSRWYEDAPMIVLEAFGAGLPVVGTRIGGVPELVEEGVDGHLVPLDDVPALAAVLDRLAADPARAHALGAAGRAKVQRLWSPQAHLEALAVHYAEAVARARPVQRRPRRRAILGP